MQGIPASPSRMESIRSATAVDGDLQSVIKLMRSRWPEYNGNVPLNIRAYVKVENELSEANGLLIHGSRLVIPQSLRSDILN